MTNKILTQEPILEKISKLREKLFGADVSDLNMVDGWEKAVKDSLITASLKKHEGVKMIIEKVTTDIKNINSILITAKSKDLSETDRNSLIDVKEFYKWFINLFDASEKDLASMEKTIDDQLKEE